MEQDQTQPGEQYRSPDGSQPASHFEEQQADQKQPLKHSGLGISSFVIGIVSIIAVIAFAITAAASVGQMIGENGAISTEDPESLGMNVVALGLLILLSLGLSFIGLILGVISLFIKRRRKAFAIIGVVLNALLVFGFGALVVIGAVLQAGM